eukprot:TRINITY_DN16846_c0_g1_i1.p2 TRINITY_DN16846_c0_g1~~TRINITY_DN16846_c0_g1_i1.p2  ORF type:complete len:129 (-),score=12.67 TRINITY_DN16846_c0_g1_i1:379-765(-)
MLRIVFNDLKLIPSRLIEQRSALQSKYQGYLHRYYATIENLQSEIDDLNDKFATAREEIELAKEDAETVYFNESHATAKQIVDEVMEKWQQVLAQVEEEERSKLQRSMGLKMEQLKAEFKELDDLHND